jgi:hypothetical protein
LIFGIPAAVPVFTGCGVASELVVWAGFGREERNHSISPREPKVKITMTSRLP